MRHARNEDTAANLNKVAAKLSGALKGSDQFPDPRKPGRVRTDGTLSCSLGVVVDVSDTGLRLCVGAGQDISRGTRLILKLSGPDGTIACPVEAVWSRRRGLLAREVGFRFVDADQAFQKRWRAFVLPCLDMRAIAADTVERIGRAA